MKKFVNRVINILLVEDSPSEVRLTQEAFKNSRLPNTICVANDGIQAMAFLNKEGIHKDVPLPDLILLDLNMPRKDGFAVLADIKSNSKFRMIPVIILTTSDTESDINKSYDLHANCYIIKPVGFDKFVNVIKQIEDFWFTIVQLPAK